MGRVRAYIYAVTPHKWGEEIKGAVLWYFPVQPVFYYFSDCGTVDRDPRPLEAFRIRDAWGVRVCVIPKGLEVKTRYDMRDREHTCRSK